MATFFCGYVLSSIFPQHDLLLSRDHQSAKIIFLGNSSVGRSPQLRPMHSVLRVCKATRVTPRMLAYVAVQVSDGQYRNIDTTNTDISDHSFDRLALHSTGLSSGRNSTVISMPATSSGMSWGSLKMNMGKMSSTTSHCKSPLPTYNIRRSFHITLTGTCLVASTVSILPPI